MCRDSHRSHACDGRLAVMPLAFISIAGGAGIFLIFVVAFTLATTYGLYTRRGSAINQRPYANAYTDAPGALGSSALSHDESAASRYTRGTRA